MLLQAFFKPSQPRARDLRQRLHFKAIRPLASVPLDPNETGGLKHAQMPRCCGPRMRKPLRDVTGRHAAILGSQCEQYFASTPVRERPEYGIHIARGGHGLKKY